MEARGARFSHWNPGRMGRNMGIAELLPTKDTEERDEGFDRRKNTQTRKRCNFENSVEIFDCGFAALGPSWERVRHYSN